MEPYCENCEFWQRYESNRRIGICSNLGVFQMGDNVVSINSPRQGSLSTEPPASDFSIVRTSNDFGCVCYKENKETNK